MRSFMIFLNTVVMVLIVLLMLMHFLHSAPEPDKILTQTPSLPREIALGRYDNEIPFNLSKIEKMTQKNLFHPDRGKVPENPQDAKPPINVANLELMGIYKYKNKAGAIIKDSSITATPQKPVPGAAAGAPKPANQPKTVRLYKLGEQLPNGATLKKVEERTVVLEFNGAEIPLEINLGDKGSGERMKIVNNAPKATPTVVMAPKTQPGAPAPSATTANPAPSAPAAAGAAANKNQPQPAPSDEAAAAPAPAPAPAPTASAQPATPRPGGRFNRAGSTPVPAK